MSLREPRVNPVRIHLVRHGRASAGWDTALDPGLDELGIEQSREVAAQLAPLGKQKIITSPLLRCQQTALPLCEAWSATAEINNAVTEIPSPQGAAMGERTEWLRAAMSDTWAALGPRYTNFRDELVAYVRGIKNDSIVFSHFIAINAVIGAALNDDRLVIRSLDNCSVTIIEVGEDKTLTFVEGGREADTLIR